MAVVIAHILIIPGEEAYAHTDLPSNTHVASREYHPLIHHVPGGQSD